jgi:hypothetical protein
VEAEGEDEVVVGVIDHIVVVVAKSMAMLQKRDFHLKDMKQHKNKFSLFLFFNLLFLFCL